MNEVLLKAAREIEEKGLWQSPETCFGTCPLIAIADVAGTVEAQIEAADVLAEFLGIQPKDIGSWSDHSDGKEFVVDTLRAAAVS